MQLIENYLQPPGHCRLCLGAEVPIVDTGRNYDSDGFGGILYVCVNCATEMAQMFGWVPPEIHSQFVTQVDALIDHVNDIETQNELLNQLVDRMQRADLARQTRPRKGKA